MTPEIKISKEQIDKIKENLDEADFELFQENEIELLKKSREKAGISKIILARLFLVCYDTFRNNLENTKDKKVKEMLEFKEVSNLRDLLEDYGDGDYSYFIGEKIKDFVKENRDYMEKLINLFFNIFITE